MIIESKAAILATVALAVVLAGCAGTTSSEHQVSANDQATPIAAGQAPPDQDYSHVIYRGGRDWTSPEIVEGFSDKICESEEQQWASRRRGRDA